MLPSTPPSSLYQPIGQNQSNPSSLDVNPEKPTSQSDPCAVPSSQTTPSGEETKNGFALIDETDDEHDADDEREDSSIPFLAPEAKRINRDMDLSCAAVAAAATTSNIASVAGSLPQPLPTSFKNRRTIDKNGIIPPDQIKLGTSRSEEVVCHFDHTTTAEELLKRKHDIFVKNGCFSLIGKAAKDIALIFYTSFLDQTSLEISPDLVQTSLDLVKIKLKTLFLSFSNKLNEKDIILTNATSYKDLISQLLKAGEGNKATAEQMLKNLSKGNSRGIKDLFENLEINAQKLMGLFICEAIRFQEDGALARMAIRKVLDKFETYTPPSVTSSTAATIDKNNPFYDVFVTNAADIIFPLEGGKQRQLAVMGLSDSKKSNPNLPTDKDSVELNLGYISDAKLSGPLQTPLSAKALKHIKDRETEERRTQEKKEKNPITSTGMTLRSQHERAGTKTEQPHTTTKIQGLDQRIVNGEILDALQNAVKNEQLSSKEDLRKNWEGLKTRTQKTEFIKKTIIPTLENMGCQFAQGKILKVFPGFLGIETSRDDEEFS